MKKLSFLSLILMLLVGVFSSCSTKVDLYADYKDIPVIYGLLDAEQDTNYIKIIRAFSGTAEESINANEVALIPDSSNYPGKLDARLIEMIRTYGDVYHPTGTVIPLDTITIHNKDLGAFYAPDQKVYYTTARFKKDEPNLNRKYRYRLEILKGNDTVSSETGIVGGGTFTITTNSVNFASSIQTPGTVNFTLANNGAIYEIGMIFTYREQLPGQEMKNKELRWSLGTFGVGDLNTENGIYSVNYNRSTFFNLLGEAIDTTIVNADRIMDNFYITIAVGGTELYNYIEANAPSSSFSQSVPDYTNIEGGFGVFSSRINMRKEVRIASGTITELLHKTNWKFRQE